MTLDLRMWNAQVVEFGRRWRCTSVDLRGHGRSASLKPGDDPGADLLGVLDEADVERCVLVGLSLGGYEAVSFATAHRHRNRHVLMLVSGAEVRVVTTAGELLRELQLDPDRVHSGSMVVGLSTMSCDR